MSDEYINQSELVAICILNGYKVDRTTPGMEIARLLSGEGHEAVPGAASAQVEKLAEFVRTHRYQLNLECDAVCGECSYGLNIWCSAQLPRAKEVMNGQEETDEETS